MLDLPRPEALAESARLLAAAMLAAEPGQLASLHKEWRATLAELDQLEPRERSTSDDLSARRAARLGGAAGVVPADGAVGGDVGG